ncbi:hypothetical protein P154DRAFT_536231 [Amniculicola lignicola CBS 123094]|uniref:Mid2 domain-containing protein n=1 Tax=Amniculicola lignicola CBS 123094 TaxID=1392246 RepID=A0A6A5WAJ1_9PLEO|nr:hypothetical protein P154DRAFT_536231 [Amniculicola lignicola CBS 123094]
MVPIQIIAHCVAHGIVILFLLTSTTAAWVCYDRAGVESGTHLPCHPEKEKGPCCGPGDICLSTGLCSPGPNVTNHGLTPYYRPGGCTDSAWGSSCFSGCNKYVGNGVKVCDLGEYCCWDDHNQDPGQGCDCTLANIISLGVATIETTIPLSTIPPTRTVISAMTSSSSIQHITSTSPLNAKTSPSNTGSPTGMSSPSSKSSVALGTGLGVGLGIPLILAICALIFLTRKKATQKRAELYGESSVGGSAETQKPIQVHQLYPVELDDGRPPQELPS